MTKYDLSNEKGKLDQKVSVDGKNIITEVSQDVSDTLKMAEMRRNMGGGFKNETMNHVASIPMSVAIIWQQQGFDIWKSTLHGEKIDKPEYQKELLKRVEEYSKLKTMDKVLI